MSVTSPAGASANPGDTITLMAFEPMNAGATHTFSVSGARGSGVPLANIDVELAVTTYPSDGNGEASTPPV